jgi:hypothetical protein
MIFSPNLAAKIEPETKDDIRSRTDDWSSLYQKLQLSAHEKKRPLGKFELRWLDEQSFASMQRVTLIDEKWWFLNIHSPGKTRGIEGIVYRGRADKWGRTTIYNVLEYYWESAWNQSYSPNVKGRIQSILRGIWADIALICLLLWGSLYLNTIKSDLWAGGLLGAAIQKIFEMRPVIQRSLARLMTRLIKPLTEEQ